MSEKEFEKAKDKFTVTTESEKKQEGKIERSKKFIKKVKIFPHCERGK